MIMAVMIISVAHLALVTLVDRAEPFNGQVLERCQDIIREVANEKTSSQCSVKVLEERRIEHGDDAGGDHGSYENGQRSREEGNN